MTSQLILYLAIRGLSGGGKMANPRTVQGARFASEDLTGPAKARIANTYDNEVDLANIESAYDSLTTWQKINADWTGASLAFVRGDADLTISRLQSTAKDAPEPNAIPDKGEEFVELHTNWDELRTEDSETTTRVWRVVAHHSEDARVVQESLDRVHECGRIAVGWGQIGDLRTLNPANLSDLQHAIQAAYPHLHNAMNGARSLWSFLYEMRKGDLVILSKKGFKRQLFQVDGGYEFGGSEGDDYFHQRPVREVQGLNGEEVWKRIGGLGPGSPYNTVIACASNLTSPDGPLEREATYSEGKKSDVIQTRRERDPGARKACLEAHGTCCSVCDLDFGKMYDGHGEGYIHVHHLNPLSEADGERKVDPIRDLRPVCPNCHAMIHWRGGNLPLEEVRELLANSRKRAA